MPTYVDVHVGAMSLNQYAISANDKKGSLYTVLFLSI
jgi:hypothetical protein